jgi:hypothetical protein
LALIEMAADTIIQAPLASAIGMIVNDFLHFWSNPAAS